MYSVHVLFLCLPVKLCLGVCEVPQSEQRVRGQVETEEHLSREHEPVSVLERRRSRHLRSVHRGYTAGAGVQRDPGTAPGHRAEVTGGQMMDILRETMAWAVCPHGWERPMRAIQSLKADGSSRH